MPFLENGFRRSAVSSGSIWIYLFEVMLIACSYADFPLIAFHFQTTALIQTSTIPLFYAVALCHFGWSLSSSIASGAMPSAFLNNKPI